MAGGLKFSLESGRGLPQSETLTRGSMTTELRGASWSAPAPWRFSGEGEGTMQNEETWGALVDSSSSD